MTEKRAARSGATPKRLTDFLAGPARAFTHPIVDLPLWRNAKIAFLEAASWTRFEEDLDLSAADHPGLLPFAFIPKASEFLVVDVTKRSLPVQMWEHELAGFVPAYASLAKFTAALREG